MASSGPGYGERLLIMQALAIAGSVVGSTFTWRTSLWQNASPLTDGPRAALFALLPASLLLAVARVGRVGSVILGAVLGVAMIAMWWGFSTNESSTSALVFLAGWMVGVPVAAGVVAVDVLGRPQSGSEQRGRRS